MTLYRSCLYCGDRALEWLPGNMYRCEKCGQVMDDFETRTVEADPLPEADESESSE